MGLLEHEGRTIRLNWQVSCTLVCASELESCSSSFSMSVITTVIFRARLYLAQSEVGDSGNYTCVCDQNLKQTVRLVVTLGKPQSE